MTKPVRHLSTSLIENVSRRGLLKGVLATGGLVLSAQILTPRALADDVKYGADDMPHGTINNPLAFVSIAPGRHGDHRLPPLRDGSGRAHRHADDRRR